MLQVIYNIKILQTFCSFPSGLRINISAANNTLTLISTVYYPYGSSQDEIEPTCPTANGTHLY